MATKGLRRTRGYAIDQQAVERARQELGIRAPVHVLFRAFRVLDGRYTGLKGGRHVITLSSDLPQRLASRTLWHELEHARQSQELGGHKQFRERVRLESRAAGWPARRGLLRGWRYNRMPLERQAIRVERRYRRRRLTKRR
jgi:hypothetical protein